HARAAGSRGTSCWPMGPDSVPTEPSTMVDFGPEETGAGIGGVGGWVPGWGVVATCAGAAGDDGAAGVAPPTRGTGVAPGATALTGRPAAPPGPRPARPTVVLSADGAAVAASSDASEVGAVPAEEGSTAGVPVPIEGRLLDAAAVDRV